MLPKLKISTFLLERLRSVKQQSSGCLFGVFYGEGTLLLMSFNVESTIGQSNYEQIQYKFPAEIDLCGLVKFGDCTDTEAHLNDIFKDVDITDNPILLNCQLGTLVGLRAAIFMHGKLEEVPYDVVEPDMLYRDFCFTRLRCSLKFLTNRNKQSLRREVYGLRKKLTGGGLVFQIEPVNIFITNHGTNGYNITNESVIADIIREKDESSSLADQDNGKNKKNAHKNHTNNSNANANANANSVLGCNYEIIDVNLFQSKTHETSINVIATTDNGNELPNISLCLFPDDNREMIPLEVEAMAMVCKTTKVNRLYDVLIESICRSLRLSEQSMLECFDGEDANSMSNSSPLYIPQSVHFYPPGFGHFLSCSYLYGIDDDDVRMQERRKRLHRYFGLTVATPYFRRWNQCVFINEINNIDDVPLVNPHIGLRSSSVSNGKQYLVQGNYYYYHYMQQGVQDKGWGCAYRSLQTIWSWFILQGYTNQKVPQHSDIQKLLFDIGDKPQSFVGSQQWIGSTEISLCLQSILKVNSRILHVTSGKDLGTLVSDLIVHFQTQGTPIMIGGGVFAHTIIGVDYSSETGDFMFLILDPHYVGADDLRTVQGKGWCGWKSVDFFDKNHYYNLCLPQRPIMF